MMTAETVPAPSSPPSTTSSSTSRTSPAPPRSEPHVPPSPEASSRRASRKPIWGERGEDGSAPTRDVVAVKAPGRDDDPWYVRMWLAAYMRYRGLSDSLAEGMHYSGAELQALGCASVTELFISKCGLGQTEAAVLGRDVWEMIQAKLPPARKPTQLDKYARLVGEDATSLRRISAPKVSIFGRIYSFLLWVRVLFKTIAFTYVGAVFIFAGMICLSLYISPEESQTAKT